MKSKKPKVAHEVLGKPLVRWVVDAAHEVGIEHVVCVVGHAREQVIPLVEHDTQVVVQAEQRGTADAVAACKDALAGFDGSLVVLSGDCPLITAATIRRLVDMREQADAAVVVLTMELENPYGYGRIVRDRVGAVERIVEQKDANSAEAAICECNSGFYCFDARALFAEALARHKAEIAGEADRVREAGGLFIIGTERHDSRRIDNQLRGRAGRQGDPGETRFYLSLEDDLLRLFGGERITNLMDRMNLDEDTPIENKMLSKSIENAQTSVESRNFQSRKATLEYDDVMNKQREIIYGQRKQVLDGRNLKDTIFGMIRSGISNQVTLHTGEHGTLDEDGVREILGSLEGMYFPRGMVTETPAELAAMGEDELTELFFNAAVTTYERKEEAVTSPIMRELERVVLLRVVDEYWMDHIDAMQELRQGIRLRAYAQVNPIDAYKKESLEMFEEMISAIQDETVRRIFSARIKSEAEVKRERVAEGIVATTAGDGSVKKQPRKVQKIGRNDPCPCGSGLKWKKCTCAQYHPDQAPKA